ncbi:helix-turn-helix transcriptional regulator [Methylocystis sp. JAN1]|uniref:helix-turn-helix transcriptional regulator n=1 Tax=Methylocystis sp. JAN1 TaxID=3397211 RepID=UPI003FA2E20A
MTKTTPPSSDHRIPRLIPIAEVGDILGLAESTIWEHIRRGRIRAVRLGKRATRVPDDEIRRIVAEGLSDEAA